MTVVTVFFLPVDPMDKNHKDLDTIDLEAPRLVENYQLSIYGAVSDLSERQVSAGQSDTHSIEIPAQEIVLQKHKERAKKFAQTRSIDRKFVLM